MHDSPMAQKLRIKIVDFKTRMMHMWNRIFAHEERVVINVFITTVNMSKEAYHEFSLW